MKLRVVVWMGLVLASLGTHAQERIYRCGNEYTNTVAPAQVKNCKLVDGGNVTVVPANRAPKAVTSKPASANSANASAPGNRMASPEQKARDSDAQMILQSELKKAEARHAELQREYNNGEPEKRGEEARNYQKYLDRVAELKASLARNDSDMAGIRRELGRFSSEPVPK